MNTWCRPASLLLVFILCPPLTADQQEDPELILPHRVYAAVGSELGIWFDNIVLTQTPEQYQFEVNCGLGQSDTRRWHVIPTAKDTGVHNLTIQVRDSSGRLLTSAETQLCVAGDNAGAGHDIRLLLIGDSLTHATQYPNALAELLNRPANPRWSMIGTHRPPNAAAGIAHEGYGGWTWQRFVSHYEPAPDGTHRKRSSPFVFLNSDSTPQLNVTHYLDTAASGSPPDIVFFLLGINDCFGANPDDIVAIDERIDRMLAQADTLIAAFQKAAPDTDLAVCITTPPNSRAAAFEANYKGRYTRWGWKRIQHRLVRRLLTHFHSQDESDQQRLNRVFIVPTQLNLDPVDGYPANNGVHPNATGYRQIANSLYAWLKWHLQPQEL